MTSQEEVTAQLKEDVRYGLLFSPKPLKVTQAQVDYFTANPDEIEEYSSPINIHSYFLFFGGLVGTGLVGLSKVIKFSELLSAYSPEFSEFAVDIVFEIGVALIGAVATAYFLGILMNRQQQNAAAWRAEIRRIIEDNAKGGGAKG